MSYQLILFPEHSRCGAFLYVDEIFGIPCMKSKNYLPTKDLEHTKTLSAVEFIWWHFIVRFCVSLANPGFYCCPQCTQGGDSADVALIAIYRSLSSIHPGLITNYGLAKKWSGTPDYICIGCTPDLPFHVVGKIKLFKN